MRWDGWMSRHIVTIKASDRGIAAGRAKPLADFAGTQEAGRLPSSTWSDRRKSIAGRGHSEDAFSP